MKWWVSNRAVLSSIERDVARLTWTQVEILTRLKELRKMTVVVARPGDRGAALAELWQLRDELSKSDPDLAAQLHSIYNKFVTNTPGEPEGPDAA